MRIDWVEDAAIVWGIQKRRLEFGGYFHGDNKFHFDGSSARSVAGKIFEEGDGASAGGTTRRFAEGLTGDALLFRRAMVGLQEHRVYLLTYKYVIPKRWMQMKCKVQALCDLFPEKFTCKQAVYDDIGMTHVWISARWPNVPQGANVPELVATQ